MTATQRPGRLGLAPAPRPRPAGPRPAPPLRIVRAGELSPQGRRRRRRLLAFGTAALTSACLFGVVVVHVVLAQQQFELASLQTRTASEQTANEALRLEVAQLQAPARIVSEARQKLGMVPPPTITYLVPGQAGPPVRSPAAAAPARAAPAVRAAAPNGAAAAGAAPTRTP